jgi:hypothetical protein
MSIGTHKESARATARELWPGIREPRPAPLRAGIARWFVRRAASQAGIRVVVADGATYGMLLRSSAGSLETGRSDSARPTWPGTGTHLSSFPC